MQRREAGTSTLACGSGFSNATPRSERSSSSGGGGGGNAAAAGDSGAGQHVGKRQKTDGRARQRRGGEDSTARKRKRLLADAAKIAAGEDSLKSFLDLVTSVQAEEILTASPPYCFVGELLAHLLRLLPLAAASLEGASTFIECLEPFEDLDDFVLPAYFYRAIAAAKEPPPPSGGHNWKRKNDRSGLGAAASAARTGGGGGAAFGSRRPLPQVTGLQTVKAYLCMNGKDAVECGGRTVVATLTRALLGSWDGSVLMGRELFDQSVLKSPDRSGPVGLGLEVLLQCLVQEDGAFCRPHEAEDTTFGEDNGSNSEDDEDDGHSDDGDANDISDDTDAPASSRTSRSRRRRRRTPPGSKASPSSASTTNDTFTSATAAAGDEARACVTIVGNYVRACVETSASFFRDILPKVLLMGMAGAGGRRRGARSRSSFNLERMIIHTVQEVKEWGDPAAVPSPPGEHDALSALYDHASVEGTESGAPAQPSKEGGGGAGEKLRRRGLVLACLDVLGPTEACLSLIRREMVDGESKAALRSAVPDGLLEYRRTCDTADAKGVEVVLLGALSSLLEDGLVRVRLSAVAAVGEGCSSDCAPAASLLLKRCLDTAPKVRELAVRLLVDEFRLGIGAAGVSLARAVLLPPSTSAATVPSARSDGGRGRTAGGSGRGDGRLLDSGGGSGATVLLGELLRHRKTLEQSDRERFPRLLRGLVEAVMRGGGQSATNGCGGATDGDADNDGDSKTTTPDGTIGEAPLPSGAATASANDPIFDPWRGGDSWEDLAAPAARLWAACRPAGPAELEALDEVLGDVFGRGVNKGPLLL
eukprot:g15452.t1